MRPNPYALPAPCVTLAATDPQTHRQKTMCQAECSNRGSRKPHPQSHASAQAQLPSRKEVADVGAFWQRIARRVALTNAATTRRKTMNNFTPRAQQVLAFARSEADRLNHRYVGTEHLLLGLVKLGQGVGVNVLQSMAIDLERVRMEVEKMVGSGPQK